MPPVYHSTDHVGEMVDPNLKYSTFPSPESTHWYPQGFSRGPMVPNDTYYVMNPPWGGRQPDGVSTPIHFQPPSMFARQGTPSGHSSSASGSEHTPSTPPDESTYTFPNHCDPWASQTPSQMVQMTGMSDGVKLGDVNPLDDEVFQGYHEEKPTELPLRSFTLSSMGSHLEVDHMGPTEPIHFMRQASPTVITPRIKDEIFIPSNYPSPDPEDDGNTSMDETEAPPQPIQDDEDDEDYKPKGCQRRGSGAKRSNRGRKRSSASQANQQLKKIKTEPRTLGNKNLLADKSAISGSLSSHPCPDCPDVSFKDENGLQNHIKKQHTRPFVCVFAFAGCPSTFAAKNEWKRHVASQHLLLFYWLCSQGTCTKVSNSSSSTIRSPQAPNLPNGAIFNRKDLYTQHVRRMHVPLNIKKQLKQKNTVPEWEDSVQGYQKEAHKPRCSLPTHMTCPAPGCSLLFNGTSAWDEQMEHLAKHLEKAAAGIEQRFVFDGANHPTLVSWASRPDVAIIVPDGNGGWILNNPLKPEKNAKAPRARHYDDEDEDAEGEVVDDY